MSEEHVDVRSQFSIHLSSTGSTADSLPQRRPIITVVADHGSVTAGGLHRLLRNLRRRRAQRAKDSAGMKPAHTLRKDTVPVHIARLHLRNRGMPAIHRTNRIAYTESTLHEINAVPRLSSNAVVLAPKHMVQIDASLEHQIFDQTAHRIIDQRGNHGGLHPKDTSQSAGHVILATSFPDAEVPRLHDALFAGVKP